MSDALRCSALEGRRVYRARRPSRTTKKPESTPEPEVAESEEIAVAKVGKVRACLFHPTQKRFVGFLVRRPDVLLMFHRKDLFVGRGDFSVADKTILIETGGASDAKPHARIVKDGPTLSECVIWTGLDVVTRSGERLGYVGDVVFDEETGTVESVVVSEGSAQGALLGKKVLPAALISGFARGIGSDLVDDEGRAEAGALLVEDEAANQTLEGGIAEGAGKAVARATHSASKAVSEIKPKVASKAAEFKSKYIDVEDDELEEASSGDDAGDADGESQDALERGAQAVGRQLKRAQGMFGDFLDEYRKARDE